MAGIKNKISGIGKFFRKVKLELKKVNWPNKEELSSYTVVVLITVIVLVAFLGVIDVFLTRIITSFIM